MCVRACLSMLHSGSSLRCCKARTRCLLLQRPVWGFREFITFTQKYVKISSRSLERVILHLSIYRKVTKSSENVHLQPRISTICSFASWNVAEEQFSKYVIIFWQDSPENINHSRRLFPLSRLQPRNLFSVNSNCGATKYQIMLFWLNWTRFFFSYWWNLLLFKSVFRHSCW